MILVYKMSRVHPFRRGVPQRARTRYRGEGEKWRAESWFKNRFSFLRKEEKVEEENGAPS